VVAGKTSVVVVACMELMESWSWTHDVLDENTSVACLGSTELVEPWSLDTEVVVVG
jgi:hypothetical protein